MKDREVGVTTQNMVHTVCFLHFKYTTYLAVLNNPGTVGNICWGKYIFALDYPVKAELQLK